MATKKPAKKSAALDKAAVVEAMAVGFAGRTSPTKLADTYAQIWVQLYGKKSYAAQPWAMWVTGYGKSDG